MSDPIPCLCPITVLEVAKAHSCRVPYHLRHWREDIAASAVLEIVELHARGILASDLVWRLAISNAVRQICGDARYSGRAAATHVPNALDALAAHGLSPDDRGWCLSRLSDVWETLTPLQRASVTHWLCGEPTPGVSRSSAANARTTAWRRLREPQSYTRVAYREERNDA